MPEPLKEGRDYIIDSGGRYIFTRDFLLGRGQCCGSGCRNCPYDTTSGGSTPSTTKVDRPTSKVERRN